MNSSVASESSIPDNYRVTYGNRLYIAAWIVEIIAASIGLFLAGAQITQGSAGLTDDAGELTAGAWITIVLGALPFVVVAVVELTKIPLATAAFIAKERLNRFLFLAGLLLVTFVTFETFLNGFEQNFTVRTAPVKKLQREIHALEAEIDRVSSSEQRIQELTLETIDRNFEAQRQSLSDDLDATISALEAQIQAKREEVGGSKLPVLASQIEQIRSEINRLQLERDSETARISSEFDDRIAGLKETVSPRTSALNQQINQLSSRQSEIEAQIGELNVQRLALQQTTPTGDNLSLEFEELRATRIQEARQKLEDRRSNLIDDRNRLQETLADERSRYDELGLFSGNQKQETLEAIEDLQTQINRLNTEISALSLDDEIARIDQEIDTLQNQRQSELNNNLSSQINVLEEQVEVAEKQLNQVSRELSAKRQELQSIVGDGKLDQVLARKNAALGDVRQRYETEISEMRTQITQLEEDRAETQVLVESSVAPFEERKRAEITRSQEAAEQQLRTLQERQQAERDDFNNQKARLAGLATDREGLEADLLEHRAEIEVVAAGSQIYRLAVMVYDDVESAADVGPEHTKWISILWFGSLAAIIAITGTLLAYASLVMRFGRRESDPRSSKVISDTYQGIKTLFTDTYDGLKAIWPAIVQVVVFFASQINRLIRSFRLLLLSLTRRLRAPKIIEVPVEVEKEVEVEKIVEKEVEVVREVVKEVPVDKVVLKEVPVEVVREKVIHVPIASDDLSILDLQRPSPSPVKSGESDKQDD